MGEVFQPDQVINGRYRVLRKLGGGGMANVYLCEDLTLGRYVALKVLLQRFLSDATFIERFRREAKAAAGLNQANLVSIYDWGEVEGTYYIVMEYVEGETLKDYIRREGRLSGDETVRVALQLLAGVRSAHRYGIVHRDIKPQNVMIDRDGNVKVMDFGIARAGDSGMTEVGSILGTAQYLAPEQAQGYPVDARSDLYSVGIVLYEMLTGSVPFKGDSAVTVALKHVNEMASEPARLVPDIPYALNKIVLKAIAKNPELRYQSADEFTNDLQMALTGGALAAAAYDADAEATAFMRTGVTSATAVMPKRPARPVSRSSREREPEKFEPRRRRVWPTVIIIVALLAVIAAAAFGVMRLMGNDGVAVPNVVGQQREAAVAALKKEGFEASVHEEFSEKDAEGTVLRQAPVGGTRLREGQAVDLWVSKGAQKVTLVSFKGWSSEKVQAWLEENGLSGVERTGKSDAVDEGQVYRQDPAAGVEVKRGDSVTYWVSSGKKEIAVPNLVGMTQAAAEQALTDAGLAVGTVRQQSSSTVPSGSVISQDPVASTKVAKGAKVSLVVSSGTPTPTPTPTTTTVDVPDLEGMEVAAAISALKSRGLLASITKKSGTGQPPGTVVGVFPEAGTEVKVGSTVTLEVAK